MEALIMKMIMVATTAALIALLLWGCKKEPDVYRAYDFSLSSWYLQSSIERGEQVEIRLTLSRDGDYKEAEYFVGYIQMEGSGELYDVNGVRLTSRELYPLDIIPDLNTSDPGK